MDEFIKYLNLEPMSGEDLKRLSPLKLAYLGDAIFGSYIRTYLMITMATKVNDLHRRTTDFVKASAQAQIFQHVEPLLTEAERSIMMRGRNQKTKTVAKNAAIGDYRQATGFEALIGYLALNHQQDRLHEIIKIAIRLIESNPSKATQKQEKGKVL